MTLNKNLFYKIVLITVFLSQIYIPSFKFNIFFQIAILALLLFFEKPVIQLRFLETIKPLIYIFLLGFLGFIIFQSPINLTLKDIFHFSKPLLGLFIGYFTYKAINDRQYFFKIIIEITIISAIIHFLIVLFFTNFTSGSVAEIRGFTKDNFLELFALFILVFYKKFTNQHLIESSQKRKIYFYILLISCVLYFSRTMIISAVVILLTVYGQAKITIKSLKIIGLTILSVILLYVYLYSIKIDRNGTFTEEFLHKIKIAPEEIFKTKIDREDHKDLWDHWRGYETKRAMAKLNDQPISYITGTGYGSLVNLKFEAPLTGEDEKGLKYISELHNGFSYILYKIGLLGLFLYLFFLFSLYMKVYAIKTFENTFIAAIGLFYFFTTFTITGLYNIQDSIIIVLGALLMSIIKN